MMKKEMLICSRVMMSERAKELAEFIHRNQHYGIFPYTRHVGDVVRVLGAFGFNDDVMTTAGWLHDGLEDTGLTYSNIKKAFGTEVAELIYGVTDADGRTRREKKENTYQKIINAGIRCLALKLADRIANVEFGIVSEEKEKTQMYREEYPHFKESLSKITLQEAVSPNSMYDLEKVIKMWEHLDNLLKS